MASPGADGRLRPDNPLYREVETLNGPMLVFRRDTGVSQLLAELGDYGAGEQFVYRPLLSPGDVFVDVGANIGAISFALLRQVPGLIVRAFEPQPALHALAAHNLLPFPDARVLPYAVGRENALIRIPEIDLSGSGNYGDGDLRRQSRQALPVPVIRLDDFLGPRVAPPRLIKIDVQGMEAAVIEGAEGLFHEGLVLSVEAEAPEEVAAWLPALLERGARCYAFFLRHSSRSNPRHDPDHPRAREVSPHILAFLGAPPLDFLAQFSGNRIGSVEDYRQRMGPLAG